MVHLIVELSKYALIILFSVYTYECFAVFRNISELQQIPLVFILFDENASGSLAIFPIDKTVTGRI
mgnify:CR=1 FL=1